MTPATIWDYITTFLSSVVSYLGTILTTITGSEVLTVFCIGVPVISLVIGILARLLGGVRG